MEEPAGALRQAIGRIRQADGSGVGIARQPAGLLQRAAEDELDLRVGAAQIVVRPPLHGVEQPGIDPQEEGLALGHEVTRRRRGAALRD